MNRPSTMETLDERDVIGLLLRQHVEIRELFDEVANATGKETAKAFTRLVRLLAIHETAEEEIVHPYARKKIDGGEAIVADRLREEHEAKELLAIMDERGVSDPSFPENLQKLRASVLEHAQSEERYEFNQLVQKTSDAERRTLAKGVKAAEALAPTHPHPGMETATKNLLMGTPAAMMDRARDVIREAMGKEPSPRDH